MNKLILTIGFFAVLCKLFDTRAALYGAAAAYAAFVIQRLIKFNSNLRKVTHIPSKRYLLTPWSSVLSFILPTIPYINAPYHPKINDAVTLRKYYDVTGVTITSFISAFNPRIALWVADDIAIRAIIADRRTFPKPVEVYRLLAVYGENVVIAEGDVWRKHRKIVAPAFSEKTNGLNWTVAQTVARHWTEDLDRRTKQQKQQQGEENALVIEVDMNKVCLHLSFSILTATVFGITIASPGQTADPVPSGHQHSLKDTLEGALDRSTLLTTIGTPKWMLEHLPLAHFKRAHEVKAELDQWITEIVEQRRQALHLGEEREDLLFNLIKANDALQAQQHDLLEKENVDHTDGKAKSEAMDPGELVGNIFVFFLAGHETIAHTLAFALGLLALHPSEQEKLYDQIISINPDREADIPYADWTLYTRALAIVYETLRLYPPIIVVPKSVTTAHDVVLPTSARGPGGTGKIFVPRGTHLSLDVQSLHHDPFYWPDPEEFKPDRFVDTDDYKYNRDAFLPFSGGGRSCVGRKFAEVELVSILIHLCRNYRVIIPDSMQTSPEETLQAKRKRILVNQSQLTLTPLNLSLGFKAR